MFNFNLTAISRKNKGHSSKAKSGEEDEEDDDALDT
jgi:hypothetical protein